MAGYFTSLPNELLINIFNNLCLQDLLAVSQISPIFEEVANLVCRKKKRLIFRTAMPPVYNRILDLHLQRAMAQKTSLKMNLAANEILNFELDSDDKPFQLPANFTTLFPHITQLIIIANTLQNRSGSNYEVLNSLLVALPRLELLKLVTMAENILLSMGGFSEPKPLRRVKHLSLYSFKDTNFYSDYTIYQTFPNVEELYLNGIESTNGFFNLRHFRSLKRLSLQYCNQRSCISQLNSIHREEAAKIRHLTVRYNPDGFSKPALDELDEMPTALIKRQFPNLLTLNEKKVV